MNALRTAPFVCTLLVESCVARTVPDGKPALPGAQASAFHQPPRSPRHSVPHQENGTEVLYPEDLVNVIICKKCSQLGTPVSSISLCFKTDMLGSHKLKPDRSFMTGNIT